VPEITAPVDLVHPSTPRVYDYVVGGSAHWAVDREFGERMLRQFPQLSGITRATRTFGNRVVRNLVKRGVRQFLDVGSGVMSAANTHQIADEIDRDSRVVYVEYEPVSAAHAELLLDEEGDPDRHAIIAADLECPEMLWDAALDTGILDPAEPIAVLMFSVLLRLRPEPDGDDAAARLVARYRELLPAGCYLALSHVTDEDVPEDLSPKLAELKCLCADGARDPMYYRSHAQIEALLGGFTVIDPGVVWTPLWHPEETSRHEEPIRFATPNHAIVRGGVGLKI
jgi:hypothetical protein